MSDKKLTAAEKEQILLAKQQLEQEASQKQLRIKNRQLLETYQPVVFRMLNQALQAKALSHAYLFLGPQGGLKKEMAFLLAESIFCESEGLIREEEASEEKQDIVRRVENGSYGDFLYIDGNRKMQISKEELGEIQQLFAKTSLEKSNAKVYILEHIENTSIQAMNSILKFLEEPAENVYAILTTDNVERLLPTIVSRCVNVPFHPLPNTLFQSLMEEEGIDEEDCFLLYRVSKQIGGYGDLVASDAYQIAKTMLKQYIGVENNKDLLLVDYDLRYRKQAKDMVGEDKAGMARDINMDILNYFFSFLLNFYKDVMRYPEGAPTWYHSAIESLRSMHTSRTYEKQIEIIVEQRDRCNRTNDLNLLLAQTIARLEAL